MATESETQTAPIEKNDLVVSKAAETVNDVVESIGSKMSSVAHWLYQRIEDIPFIPDGWVNVVTHLILVAALALACWLSFAVFRPLILKAVLWIANRTPNRWDSHFVGHGLFHWLTHLLPALLIRTASPGLFEGWPTLVAFLVTFSRLYIIVAGFFAFISFLDGVRSIYRSSKLSSKFEIDTFIQVFKLVAALIATLLFIAILIGRSPLYLLGGLGVFASILILVFKDVLLGFVAGIQLASNKMLSPGDWVELPDHDANGTVEQIGLTTVKVRNFDNTITALPTYALITHPFKNWQGMQNSGGRRIKRHLLIDVNTIQHCDDQKIKALSEIPLIKDYLESKAKEIASSPNSRRQLTNVGTFRAYIEAYLKDNPHIHQEMTLIVRQLPATPQGLPIEIYCFTNTTAWADYESIQADIFDHLFATAPEFDLRIFQDPSGTDFQPIPKS